MVRYIKLGRGGCWAEVSLANGELHFGDGDISHEIASAGSRVTIKQAGMDQGQDARTAEQDAREIFDFYQLGADCLWITFARGHLWWTFAAPDVLWLGHGEGHGERVRKSVGGWRNTNLNGEPLKMFGLSSQLTKVAAYRRTICAVEAQDYLLRRINGIEEPLAAKGKQARAALLSILGEAIASLHWKDFETLIDVIFVRAGWHRVSALGGSQKLVDLVLEQVATNEVAAVQVKSSASQSVLEDYIGLVDEVGTFSRSFFICHTPLGSIAAPPNRRDVHVWSGEEIAVTALRLGLSDWIIERAST